MKEKPDHRYAIHHGSIEAIDEAKKYIDYRIDEADPGAVEELVVEKPVVEAECDHHWQQTRGHDYVDRDYKYCRKCGVKEYGPLNR